MEASEAANRKIADSPIRREGYAVGRVYPPNSYVRGKLTLDEWSLRWAPDDLGMGQKLFDWVDKPLVLSLGDIQSVTIRRVRRRQRLVIRADKTYECTRITPKAGSYYGEIADDLRGKDTGLEAWFDELKPHARSTEPDDAPLAPLIDNAIGVTLLAIMAVSGIGCAAIALLTGMPVMAGFLAVSIAALIYFILDAMRPQ